MHNLLKKTHLEENINILKVRDYYFNKARILNNRYRKWCMLAPIVLSVVGMMFCFFVRTFFSDAETAPAIADFVEAWLDIVVGIVAVASFIIDCILSAKVGENLNISNHFRELYDCRVFDLPENQFFSAAISENIETHLKKAGEVCDSNKYEVWYRELFCENDFYNRICLVMDNVIYTCHVYKANSRRILNGIYLYLVIFMVYTLSYVLFSGSLAVMVNPLILLVAVFDDIKNLISSYGTAKELYMDNKGLKEYVINNAGDIRNIPENEQENFLRRLQDVVYFNRSKALFIPKSIRDKFLDNKCIFYRELDEVKSIFMTDKVSKPEKEADFDIPVPSSHRNGADFVSMKDLHDELRGMLEDVGNALNAAGIEFLLDGGTLIGCIRKSNKNSFLAWDDDVDLSIRSEDVQRAKEVIEKKLGEKYVIQDYYNEKYYSPRLSTFRVRQKNDRSFIDEKDSPLYELYEQRGLFLDIYAYCPVLINKCVDRWYRRLFIHPLHRKILAVELAWKEAGADKRGSKLERFLKLKARYMKRSEWYKKHAKCRDHYAYEPHYIENISTPGPYIPKEDLYYPKVKQELFEGKMYGVPAIPENVLRAFYGKNWEASPLIPVEVLKKPEVMQYHPVWICQFTDMIFKKVCVLPRIRRRERYIRRQKLNNDYIRYNKRIERLSAKISRLDEWYDKHAGNAGKYALKPGSINSNSVNLYYDPEMIEAEDRNTGFNRHMYSRSSFEASVYKHVKGVWIKGKC